LDGLALHEAIARKGRRLPTLFLSAYSVGVRPRLSHDHAVLDKPFLPGDLLAAVETLLQRGGERRAR
jgi:DNA-binding response OmpR family regulator